MSFVRLGNESSACRIPWMSSLFANKPFKETKEIQTHVDEIESANV